MKQKNALKLAISLIVYLVGLALSLTFNTFTLWAGLEGQSFWGYPEALAYDASLTTEARISRLTCPMVITPGEVSVVKLTVSNPNDDPINAWVSAHISMPDVLENMVRELTSVPLAPGEKSTLQWEIGQDNIIHNRMILVRVFLRLTDLHPPSRTKHCGIIAIDLWGLSSTAIMLLSLVVGHILQVVGIWLWWHGRMQSGKKDNLTSNVLIALTILSILMTVSSLFHGWIFGLISLLLSMLLVFTAIGYGIGKVDRAT